MSVLSPENQLLVNTIHRSTGPRSGPTYGLRVSGSGVVEWVQTGHGADPQRCILGAHASSHCLTYRNTTTDECPTPRPDSVPDHPAGWLLRPIIILSPACCPTLEDAEWRVFVPKVLKYQLTSYVTPWFPHRALAMTSTLCPYGCWNALVRLRCVSAGCDAGQTAYYKLPSVPCLLCQGRVRRWRPVFWSSSGFPGFPLTGMPNWMTQSTIHQPMRSEFFVPAFGRC